MRGLRSRCPNLNHMRETASVRYCPECGETVNGNIHPDTCSPKKHALERWNRNRYCTECGERILK